MAFHKIKWFFGFKIIFGFGSRIHQNEKLDPYVKDAEELNYTVFSKVWRIIFPIQILWFFTLRFKHLRLQLIRRFIPRNTYYLRVWYIRSLQQLKIIILETTHPSTDWFGEGKGKVCSPFISVCIKAASHGGWTRRNGPVPFILCIGPQAIILQYSRN